MNIDKHPLRYSLLTQALEGILLRRLNEGKATGYTLEAAIELAEMAVHQLRTVDCLMVDMQVRSFWNADESRVDR